MAKKVYDIKPPKIRVAKKEKEIKEFFKETQAAPVVKKTKERRFPAAPAVFLGGGVLVLVAMAVLFFKLPKAEIQIWPKVETLTYVQTVTADESADSLDYENGIIPARRFEITKTLSEEFPATGNAGNEGRASGTIIIYNKYDPPASMTLKAGTHFLSDSGKLFKAPGKIVIPAGKKSGSKVTPGSVSVQVQAVEGGESFNIPPSDFSIPGLKGTAYYYSIYASSEKSMQGGFSGDIKKVSDGDIQSAKESLSKKLEEQGIAELRAQLPEGYFMPDDAFSFEITGAGTETKSGSIADKFSYQATINLSGLAFKESDLEEIAKKHITSQMPEKMTLLESGLKVESIGKSVDVEAGKLILDATFSSGIYKSIDKNALSLQLSGKNAEQINEIVSGAFGDQLSRTKVSFWPFWVSKSPASQKAIEISLKFD